MYRNCPTNFPCAKGEFLFKKQAGCEEKQARGNNKNRSTVSRNPALPQIQ